MRARQSTAQDCKARLVVTMPPLPSRLDKALANSPGAGMLTLTDTVDAFRHLARRASHRLIVMMPFIDNVGCDWVLDMFSVTPASNRILILKQPRQLGDLKDGGDRLRAAASQIHYYTGEGEIDETFHSKVVLADGVAAYVGSANLLNRSKSSNLECGLLVEGAVVTSISTFVDAVIETFRVRAGGGAVSVGVGGLLKAEHPPSALDQYSGLTFARYVSCHSQYATCSHFSAVSKRLQP